MCGPWYPKEEIFRYLTANQTDWVRQQRKISRKAKDNLTFFTHRMLSHRCRICSGIKGIDPDRSESKRSEEERKWLSSHPEIVVTEEMRERCRDPQRQSASRI